MLLGGVLSITEKEFHEALDKLIEVLEVRSPFFLVVQVWKKNMKDTCIGSISYI